MAEVNLKEKYSALEAAMNKVSAHLQQEFNSLRAGRANPKILDKITVDYYGQPTLLKDMANISVPEARQLVIALWDTNALKEVNKAILASDLGVTPTDDGKVIRLNFPQLTEERRKELVKNIKKLGEDAKIALRNVRRDGIEDIKKLKKDSLLSEDALSAAEKEVQKITDKYTAGIDGMIAAKEKEVLEV